MPVSPGYIKMTGNLLLERYPETFVFDLEQNKENVEQLTNVESKDVRNRITGYITRKKRTDQISEEAP